MNRETQKQNGTFPRRTRTIKSNFGSVRSNQPSIQYAETSVSKTSRSSRRSRRTRVSAIFEYQDWVIFFQYVTYYMLIKN